MEYKIEIAAKNTEDRRVMLKIQKQGMAKETVVIRPSTKEFVGDTVTLIIGDNEMRPVMESSLLKAFKKGWLLGILLGGFIGVIVGYIIIMVKLGLWQ